eukprot:1057800-Rhodomonas_salina.1
MQNMRRLEQQQRFDALHAHTLTTHTHNALSQHTNNTHTQHTRCQHTKTTRMDAAAADDAEHAAAGAAAALRRPVQAGRQRLLQPQDCSPRQ